MRHLRAALEIFEEPLGPSEISKIREAYTLALSSLVLSGESEKLTLASVALGLARTYIDASAAELADRAVADYVRVAHCNGKTRTAAASSPTKIKPRM